MGVGQGSVAICAQGWLLSPPPLLPITGLPFPKVPWIPSLDFLRREGCNYFKAAVTGYRWKAPATSAIVW